MAEDSESPRRIIIPKGTLDPGQNNVIDIPDVCEDSRVLIAKLQARFNKPPRYYPPKTNPYNKFERQIGDTVVGLGMPPCSPIPEERHNYKYSLSKYGSPKPIPYESYEPSYFGTDTTHGSRSISGKFDYCPTSTPIATRSNVGHEFPSPHLSPIKMGRDIFAPEPSVYRGDYTPPPRPLSPSPAAPCPCSAGQESRMMNSTGSSGYSAARAPSPRRVSPPQQRTPPRQQKGPPPRRAPPPRRDYSDSSASIGDLSDMMSFDASRGYRSPLNYTPDSIKGISQIYRNQMAVPTTPIPEELHNRVMNNSMAELDSIEIDELRTIQERMRSFQDARRELVLSILALPEAEVSIMD